MGTGRIRLVWMGSRSRPMRAIVFVAVLRYTEPLTAAESVPKDSPRNAGRMRVMGQEKIVLYGSPYCGMIPRARRLLEQAGAQYEHVDITRYADARARVREINEGFESVPTLAFPDGSTSTEPTAGELRAKLEGLGNEFAPSNWRDRLSGIFGS